MPNREIERQIQDIANLKRVFSQAIRSATLCLLIIQWPQISIADERPRAITIDGIKPETTHLNGGASLIVAPSGKITASPGIYAVNDLNTIKHSGATSTAGISGIGIFANGSSNAITNAGSIDTTALSGFGIFANGASNAIINAGSIDTTALSGFGIFANGASNAITNAGSIDTTALSGFGIFANGASNAITNAGSIDTTALSGFGIFSNGASNAITNAGSIDTTALSGFGIFANGASYTITNAGSIGTTALSGFGILANGSSNTITNAGSIATNAASGFGIFANGSNNAITNAGSVATTAINGFSILTNGSRNTITNAGSISTAGGIVFSILAAGSNNIITNSGTISTTGALGVSIHSDKGHNTISNTGSIHSTGTYGIGILTNGSSNTITNSGSISTSGEYAIGIYSSGRSNTVTNTGKILSRNGYAIYFDGIGNTLNIHNAFFDGGINMGIEGTVNIATDAESSNLLTFEGDVSSINGSGPVPLFINLSTQQAATYDPTVFASSSDALADMTNAISSLAPRRFNAANNEHPIWAQGFKMASNYQGSNTIQQRNYNFSGVAMGYDAKRSKELTIGVMGGYGQTSLTGQGKRMQSFKTTSDDGFMGIYGQKIWHSFFIDFAILGGLQSFQQQRFVNNNLALDGISSTNASYQGWWISTEAGVTYNAGKVYGWSLQPTARLRYAQQWMGGYTETGGGPANANVNHRSIAIGQSFVGIGASKIIKTNVGQDTNMILDGQVGYMYRGTNGDDTLEVTMIGQSLLLPTEPSNRNAVAISAGVTIDLSSVVALKIRGNYASGDGIKYTGGGWAGLSLQF